MLVWVQLGACVQDLLLLEMQSRSVCWHLAPSTKHEETLPHPRRPGSLTGKLCLLPPITLRLEANVDDIGFRTRTLVSLSSAAPCSLFLPTHRPLLQGQVLILFLVPWGRHHMLIKMPPT